MNKRKHTYNFVSILKFGISLRIFTLIVFFLLLLLFLLSFVVASFELNRGINSKWAVFTLYHY